jgi:hypothetical protein
VFAADFAVPVAVAIVETCLAHAALHCAHRREHPPAGTEWQLNYAREWHHPDDEGGPDAAFADGVNSGLSMNDRSWLQSGHSSDQRCRLIADSVAKVFLSQPPQISRAVGAAIEY